jgi:hypothetical protein
MATNAALPARMPLAVAVGTKLSAEQFLQRAGYAARARHFCQPDIVFALQLGHRYMWRLTFDMSGGWKQAKLAGRRPLDGGVGRHSPGRLHTHPTEPE